MTGEKVDFTDAAADKAPSEQRRERSTIQFPYGDLEGAENIASAIYENAGEKCTVEQLATYLKQSPKSGSFRLRVSAASIFGLTENQKGEVALTELGRRILDPAQQRKARVEAFLGVELYAAIFEKYNGYMLPPPKALEREIATLGVSSKQTDKARQAFERSAQRAAFFEHGTDRLTMPAKLGANTPETKKTENPDDKGKGKGGGSGGGDDTDPFITGLFNKLPPAESEWTFAERAEWLKTAEQVFKMIYTDKDGGEIKITHTPPQMAPPTTSIFTPSETDAASDLV